MTDILCTYERTIFRDEKTGYTVFAVKTDPEDAERDSFGSVVCKGRISRMPIGIPLRITGRYEISNGKRYLKAACCRAETGGFAAGISFLSGGNFRGIGIKKAEAVMEKAGGDLFAFCRSDDAAASISEISGITQEEASEIVQKVNSYASLQEIFTWIAQYGGTCEDAEAVFDAFGNESISRIESDPYFGGVYCLDYNTREALAKERGIQPNDRKRIRALVREAFRIAEGSGSTCITTDILFLLCRRIEEYANMGLTALPACIAAYIVENRRDYEIRTRGEKVYIYRKKLYEQEARAVSHIKRLMRSKKDDLREGRIEDIENELGIRYNEEQKKAIRLVEKSGIVLMHGGPGTGKSTTIRGMIEYYRRINPSGSVALCAPTGNAAKRLRELTGDDAETIHRMLDGRPFDNSMLACRDEYNQLPYDMIIADEFSMADTELFMMLLSGIKNGALLVLTGDENQLPSVGPGNVFNDLLSSGMFPTCRLTKVYRQKETSSILENALRIKDGNTDLLTDENTRIIYVDTDEEAEEEILSVISEDYKGQSVRLYTPVKNLSYRIGKTNMNMMIRKIKRKDDPDDEPELVYGGISFSKGDPVIMCRNNYRAGYMNGDEGVVWKVHETGDGKKFLEVNIDGDLKVISGKNLDDIDLAYALTTHKSQGSECDVSVIVVPEKPSGMLIRSLVYVAATRAKKKNIFIVQGRSSLAKAITTDARPRRITGLKEMLGSSFV